MHATGTDSYGSMKSQFKKADASGARYALIFGDSEVAAGQVAVKPLRAEGVSLHEQTLQPLASVPTWAAMLLPA